MDLCSFSEPPITKNIKSSISNFTRAAPLHNNFTLCLWAGTIDSLVGAKVLVWSELALRGPTWSAVQGPWAHPAICSTGSRSMADYNPSTAQTSLAYLDVWLKGGGACPSWDGVKEKVQPKKKLPVHHGAAMFCFVFLFLSSYKVQMNVALSTLTHC